MKKILHLPSGLLSRVILSVLLGSFACGANASVVWQLNNFVFNDATSATGSFVWDATTNTAISWNIVTVDGGRPGVNYSSATGNFGTSSSIDVMYFSKGFDQFRIGLADLNLLDTPAASLSLVSQNVGQTGANGFLECDNCGSFRLGQAGAFLSASSDVPEPSTIAMFGLAFGLIGVARLRKA